MPLLGSGMLMTFTEVPDEHEQDFNEWYNREHIDERTQLPGFLRSRRYVACEGTVSPKYVAWYETSDVSDLGAPGYMALLADQTPWSKRVMGQFSLFQRLTLRVTVDRGDETWRGNVGVVTQLFKKLDLDPEETTAIMCGPEIMMRFCIREFQHRNVPSENLFVSMERSMKCGVGFCGHCQYGGKFICRDGPVFPFPHVERLFNVREA